MLTEKQLNRVNKLLENRVFTYNDELLHNVPGVTANFDYKIKLLGYKPMISVGEKKDFLMVSVDFIKFNNEISKNVLPSLTKTDSRETFLGYFKQRLKNEISGFLSIFADRNIGIIISDFKMRDDIDTLVTEQSMSKIAIRTVVKDVISKVKNKKSGFFYLPNDDDSGYSFTNLPFELNVELTLKIDNGLDRFMVNGYYVPDEDVVEVLIIFNPNKIQSQLYDLIGELNELVAHELEHGMQEYRGEFLTKNDEPTKSFDYYTQPHEIPAQYKAFKRLSKLTKKPIDVVAESWFKNNKDIHELSDNEIKIVMDKILSYGKK
jgi:hypothetical protein